MDKREMYIDILTRAHGELYAHKFCRGVMAQKIAGQTRQQRKPCWPWSQGVQYLDGLGALSRALVATPTETGKLVPHEYCRVEGELLHVLSENIHQVLYERRMAGRFQAEGLPENDTAMLAAFCDKKWVQKADVLDLFQRAIFWIERSDKYADRTAEMAKGG